MKKRYREDKDEVEQLHKEIRELKSINRSLIKQLKKLSKGINKQEYDKLLEDLDNENLQPKQRKPNKPKCEVCGKGNINILDLAGRLFYNCDTCDYRSKKINK